MVPRDLFSSIPLFAEALDDSEIDSLAASAVAVSFDAGDVLIGEQDPTDSLFAIGSGEVAVSVHDGDREKQVATLGPGEIVGEMSMLTGAPRAATVTAATPVQAFEISRSAMKSLLSSAPHLFARLGDVLHKRQVELDRIYGTGFWARFAPPRDNYGLLMRRHLG